MELQACLRMYRKFFQSPRCFVGFLIVFTAGKKIFAAHTNFNLNYSARYIFLISK
jgi:hypothetical protein